MKKIIVALVCISFMSSCSVLKRKDRYGCPTDGRSVGAERLASGDEKAMKASQKAKYKGGRKSF